MLDNLRWSTSADELREHLGIEPHLFHTHSKLDGARDGHPHISLNPATNHSKFEDRQPLCVCVFCELDGKDLTALGFMGTVANSNGRMTPEWRAFQLDYYAKLPVPPNAFLDSGGKSLYGVWIFPTPIEAPRADALMVALGKRWGDDESIDHAVHLAPKPGTRHYRSGKPATWADNGGTTDPEQLESFLADYQHQQWETEPDVQTLLSFIPPWVPGTSQRHLYLSICWAVCAWVKEHGGGDPLELLTNHSRQKANVWPSMIADFDPRRTGPGLLIHHAKAFGYRPPVYSQRRKASQEPKPEKMLPWKTRRALVDEVVAHMLANPQALEPTQLRDWGMQELRRHGVRIGEKTLMGILNENWATLFRPLDDGDPMSWEDPEFRWQHQSFQSTGFDVLAGRGKVGKTALELQRAKAWLDGNLSHWDEPIRDDSPPKERRLFIIGPDMARPAWGKYLTEHGLCTSAPGSTHRQLRYTLHPQVRLISRHLGINALMALVAGQAKAYPHTHFIFDSLSALTPTLNENDTADMTPFLQALRGAIGAASATVLHHVNRERARAASIGEDLLRGSGAIGARFENIRTLTEPILIKKNGEPRLVRGSPYLLHHTEGRVDTPIGILLFLDGKTLHRASQEELDAWLRDNRESQQGKEEKTDGRRRSAKDKAESSARTEILNLLDNKDLWQDPVSRWVQQRVIEEHIPGRTRANIWKSLQVLKTSRVVECRKLEHKGGLLLWRRFKPDPDAQQTQLL